MKLLLPLYITIDRNADYAQEFIIVMSILLLIIVSLRYMYRSYFIKQVRYLSYCIDCTLLWICLCSFICGIIDNGSVSVLYMFACTPFTIAVFMSLIKQKQLLFLSKDNKAFKLPQHYEEQLYLLIDLILHRDKPYDRICLEGFIKEHSKSCTKPYNECNC